MTCIVGVVRDEVVYLGADSLASDGWMNSIVREDKKLFRVGEIIIGLAGMPRAAQLLRFKLDLPTIPGDADLFRWIVVEFIESVRKCWREGGYLEKKDERESGEGSEFLVGIRGRVFTVYSSLQVEENTWRYAAIGSGSSFAMGSLHHSASLGEDVDSAITLALTAAEKFNAGVRGPFHIISTKGDSHD
jgi:ATP-dependent protease HslVU (ClpYQ) peptidase subunit